MQADTMRVLITKTHFFINKFIKQRATNHIYENEHSTSKIEKYWLFFITILWSHPVLRLLSFFFFFFFFLGGGEKSDISKTYSQQMQGYM